MKSSKFKSLKDEFFKIEVFKKLNSSKIEDFKKLKPSKMEVFTPI